MSCNNEEGSSSSCIHYYANRLSLLLVYQPYGQGLQRYPKADTTGVMLGFVIH